MDCHEPPKPGPCRDKGKERWFFHPSKGKCETFQWGGCSPGSNNFITQSEFSLLFSLSCTRKLYLKERCIYTFRMILLLDECMRQCHPTAGCEETCYHGGSCSLSSNGYTTSCNCVPPWYGPTCQLSAERGMVTVTFTQISKMKVLNLRRGSVRTKLGGIQTH